MKISSMSLFVMACLGVRLGLAEKPCGGTCNGFCGVCDGKQTCTQDPTCGFSHQDLLLCLCAKCNGPNCDEV
ncbi:hypothetical protein CSOJ01_06925 [Colletotrichum sojae]|uniref:Uncharacterized protein n=1 Tax=Colletotrichum sojae TaxID=2175907 RepID=A0A8H6MUH2_9PEZI|nr:hypothetical protein CSOJ01_06925 [Colletotrichum sojae]